MGITWDVLEVEDMADRALEEWDEANAGKKRKKGVTRVAVPQARPGVPLVGGAARMHHYKTIATQQEAEQTAAAPDEDDELDGLVDRERPAQGYDASQYG